MISFKISEQFLYFVGWATLIQQMDDSVEVEINCSRKKFVDGLRSIWRQCKGLRKITADGQQQSRQTQDEEEGGKNDEICIRHG